MSEFRTPQHLNDDHFDDARIIGGHSWALDADVLVLDEIHKMPEGSSSGTASPLSWQENWLAGLSA